MLEGLFSILSKPVPPVLSPKNQREPLEPANYAAVPSVPSVPLEKTKTQTESAKITAPAAEDDRHPCPQGECLLRNVKAPDDDRHHCRECRHLSSAGYCTRQRFRSVDDMPRRCDDFTGLPPGIDRGAERKTSEAEHNAQGRFFKWLVVLNNGTQFYSCTMPRQTLTETRAQYPDAAAVEPIAGEDYEND